jgi:hypothetical protein
VIARRLRVGAVAALALAVLAYWVSTATVAGQEFGDLAFAARFAAGRQATDLAHSSPALVVHAAMLLAGSVLVAVALLRNRPRLAIGVGLLVFGTAFVAEALKVVLPRPALGVDPAALAHNTGPSGHAAVAMAVALGLVLVVPMRFRPVAAAMGAAWTAIIATGSLAAGWHRPGDALAGELMALAIALLVCAVIVQVHGDGLLADPGRAGHLATPWAVAVAFMTAGIVVVDLVVLPDAATLGTGHSEFVTAAVLIAGVAIACVVAFTVLLRDVDVDAPLSLASPDAAGQHVR